MEAIFVSLIILKTITRVCYAYLAGYLTALSDVVGSSGS